jgi:hypothetical protein
MLALGALACACYDQGLAPDFETNGRISVTNDEVALEARVTYPHANVPIAPPLPVSHVPATALLRAPSSI